jgi:lipopolysaccharide biosynthesis regulator YciM
MAQQPRRPRRPQQTRRGLAQGYIRLGELAWIYGASREEEDALLIQALLVRPYDSLVHYTAGQEAWLRGKQQAALEHWQRAFSRDADYQQLIIDMLAGVVPVQFFLENFETDAAALARLQAAYRESPDRASFQIVTQRLAEQLTRDADAARHHTAVALWRKAHEAYQDLGDTDNARRTAYAAVEADPNALGARLLLGRWLFRNHEYAAAREHLEFSSLRRMQDKELQKMLEIATQRAATPHTAITPAHYQR